MEHHEPRALPNPETVKTRPAPTPAPPRVALYAALLALCCSIIAYPSIMGIFYGEWVFGVNVPLCAALLYAAYLLAMRGQRKVDWARGWPLFLIVIPLACAPALYSVPELTFFNLLALYVAIPLHLSLLSGGNWIGLKGVSQFEQVIIDLLGRPLLYIPDGCRATMGGTGKGILRNILLTALGIAAALPVLLIVIILLCAADEEFDRILGSLFHNIDVAQIIVILFVTIAALFPLLSILYSLPLGKHVARPQAGPRQRKGVSPLPVYAALVLFDAVLILFAVIRVRGFLTNALTLPSHYAAQAHEDFFPMLAAAMICYGVQWICLRITRREGRALPLRALVTAMSAGLLVMMASALRSIVLYQGAFGMTRLRVYVTVCIVALFALLLLTLVRIWAKKIPYRALFAGVLCAALIGVNYCNVDRMIAKNNLAMRQELGANMDYAYLLTLSADALDVLIEHPYDGDESAKSRDSITMADRLAERLRQNEREQWYLRTWNFGRARTQAVYEAMPGYAPQERR